MCVLLDRFQRVPHVPVMHVAIVLAARNILEVGGWRTGPVSYRSAVLRHHTLNNVVEKHDVILPHALTLRRSQSFLELQPVAPEFPSPFHFVIAAPQGNAWMIAQALHLLDHLLPHTFLKGGVARNHGSAEHEILPDHDAQYIT